MSLFYVWGVGGASSDLVRDAEAAEPGAWPQEAIGATAEDEGWCVMVEASENDVDAATRHDSAVRGWCAA